MTRLTARLRVSRPNLDITWSREESRLWGELQATPLTEDSRAGRRLLRFAKQHGIRGRDLEDFRKAHGILSESEAVARSWKAYAEWVRH